MGNTISIIVKSSQNRDGTCARVRGRVKPGLRSDNLSRYIRICVKSAARYYQDTL